MTTVSPVFSKTNALKVCFLLFFYPMVLLRDFGKSNREGYVSKKGTLFVSRHAVIG